LVSDSTMAFAAADGGVLSGGSGFFVKGHIASLLPLGGVGGLGDSSYFNFNRASRRVARAAYYVEVVDLRIVLPQSGACEGI
jgi:hypothetical protein